MARDVKSRVHGAENLMVIMRQHALLSFASKFGCLPSRATAGGGNNDNDEIPDGEHNDDNSEDEDIYKDYLFRPPSPTSNHRLTNTEFHHLQQHYGAMYSNPNDAERLAPNELKEMDRHVKIWHRCSYGKTVFHCHEYRRRNSTRLNNLVRLKQLIDRNAHVRYGTRDEDMADDYSYVYIQFFCEHNFRNKPRMLAYSEYRKVGVHTEAAIVEDLRHQRYSFHDVTVIQHLCAKVVTKKKTYFIDSQEAMVERLRVALQL
jgi:hypothetical protein